MSGRNSVKRPQSAKTKNVQRRPMSSRSSTQLVTRKVQKPNGFVPTGLAVFDNYDFSRKEIPREREKGVLYHYDMAEYVHAKQVRKSARGMREERKRVKKVKRILKRREDERRQLALSYMTDDEKRRQELVEQSKQNTLARSKSFGTFNARLSARRQKERDPEKKKKMDAKARYDKLERLRLELKQQEREVALATGMINRPKLTANKHLKYNEGAKTFTVANESVSQTQSEQDNAWYEEQKTKLDKVRPKLSRKASLKGKLHNAVATINASSNFAAKGKRQSILSMGPAIVQEEVKVAQPPRKGSIGIFVSIDNLIQMDLLTLSDPGIALYTKVEKKETYAFREQTEFLKDVAKASFSKQFIFDYDLDKPLANDRYLKFVCHDVDHGKLADMIGQLELDAFKLVEDTFAWDERKREYDAIPEDDRFFLTEDEQLATQTNAVFTHVMVNPDDREINMRLHKENSIFQLECSFLQLRGRRNRFKLLHKKMKKKKKKKRPKMAKLVLRAQGQEVEDTPESTARSTAPTPRRSSLASPRSPGMTSPRRVSISSSSPRRVSISSSRPVSANLTRKSSSKNSSRNSSRKSSLKASSRHSSLNKDDMKILSLAL